MGFGGSISHAASMAVQHWSGKPFILMASANTAEHKVKRLIWSAPEACPMQLETLLGKGQAEHSARFPALLPSA